MNSLQMAYEAGVKLAMQEAGLVKEALMSGDNVWRSVSNLAAGPDVKERLLKALALGGLGAAGGEGLGRLIGKKPPLGALGIGEDTRSTYGHALAAGGGLAGVLAGLR